MAGVKRAGSITGAELFRSADGEGKVQANPGAKGRSGIFGVTSRQRKAAQIENKKLLQQAEVHNGHQSTRAQEPAGRKIAVVPVETGLNPSAQHKPVPAPGFPSQVQDASSQEERSSPLHGPQDVRQSCSAASPGGADDGVQRSKDPLEDPAFYKVQEQRLLEKHFYNQPGMRELAEDVAGLEPELRQVEKLWIACQHQGKSARQFEMRTSGPVLRDALEALRKKTGMTYSECVEKKQKLIALQAKHLKPVLAQVEQQRQDNAKALEAARLDVKNSSWQLKLEQCERELGQQDQELEQQAAALDACNARLNAEQSEDKRRELRARRDELNERIDSIKALRHALSNDRAALRAEQKSKNDRVSSLRSRQSKLSYQQGVLKRLSTGFEKSYRIQTVEKLSASQTALVSLLDRLEAVDRALDASPRHGLQGVRHRQERKAYRTEKQFLQKRLKDEVDSVQKLSAHLGVAPAALMVRIGEDGKVSLSDTVVALREYGFKQITPVYRSRNGSDVHLESYQAQDRRGSWEGEELLRELECKLQMQLAGPVRELEGVSVLPFEQVRALEKKASTRQAYQQDLKEALSRHWSGSQQNAKALSDEVGKLLKESQDLARLGAAGQPDAQQQLAANMVSRLPHLRTLAAALEVRSFFVDEVQFELARFKKDEKGRKNGEENKGGKGRPDSLQNSLRNLQMASEQASTKLGEESRFDRLRDMDSQLRASQKVLDALTPNQSVFARALKEHRAVLQDQFRALIQLVNGTSSDEEGRVMLQLSASERELVSRLQAKEAVGEQLKISRNNCSQSLRSFRLKSAAFHLWELAGLRKTRRALQRDIQELDRLGEEGYMRLRIGQRQRIVEHTDSGKPVLALSARVLVKSGIRELTPLYQRGPGNRVTVTYEGRDATGVLLDQDALRQHVYARRHGHR